MPRLTSTPNSLDPGELLRALLREWLLPNPAHTSSCLNNLTVNSAYYSFRDLNIWSVETSL